MRCFQLLRSIIVIRTCHAAVSGNFMLLETELHRPLPPDRQPSSFLQKEKSSRGTVHAADIYAGLSHTNFRNGSDDAQGGAEQDAEGGDGRSAEGGHDQDSGGEEPDAAEGDEGDEGDSKKVPELPFSHSREAVKNLTKGVTNLRDLEEEVQPAKQEVVNAAANYTRELQKQTEAFEKATEGVKNLGSALGKINKGLIGEFRKEIENMGEVDKALSTDGVKASDGENFVEEANAAEKHTDGRRGSINDMIEKQVPFNVNFDPFNGIDAEESKIEQKAEVLPEAMSLLQEKMVKLSSLSRHIY